MRILTIDLPPGVEKKGSQATHAATAGTNQQQAAASAAS